MGTRSLTIVREDGTDILTLYRQFDGYPTGHGAALADFMAGRVIVNGHNGDRRTSNGAGCFAAGLTSALKGRDVGNVYVYPAGSHDCGEEYVYVLDFKRPEGYGAESLTVTATSAGWGDNGASGNPDKGAAPAVLFTGSPDDYVAWIRRQQRRETAQHRARAKREGWAKPAPVVTAADALADVAAAVGALYRGEGTAASIVAVLQRFGAADARGNVSRETVRAIRRGVADSMELARELANVKSKAQGRRRRAKLAPVG